MSTLAEPRWVFSKVWSQNLKTEFAIHKESSYMYFSKLSLGDLLMKSLEFCGEAHKVQLDDPFSLVEVDTIVCESGGGDFIVQGHEPNLADNWATDANNLKLNIKFGDLIGKLCKMFIQPKDIILVSCGFMTFDAEGMTTIETDLPLDFTVNIVVFSPEKDCGFDNDVKHFVKNLGHVTGKFKFLSHQNVDKEVIKIYPIEEADENISGDEKDVHIQPTVNV